MTQTDYQEISCPVCTHAKQKLIFPDTLEGKTPNFDYKFSAQHHRTYKIVRCPQCGHAYSSPLPLDMWKNYVSIVDEAYLKNATSRKATSQKICKRLLRYAPSGKLLDIGCATADFLDVAKEHYSVEGLELSSWSATIARSRGFKIHGSFLSEIEPPAQYDVITLWGVIEHFESPLKEANQIARLLKPGGILALWTGDMDGMFSKMMGKAWWNIQGQHIQYFTKSSLTRMMKEAGLKKEWIGLYPYVMSRDAILLSLGRYKAAHRITEPIMTKILPADFHMTVALPGELFAIFRKPLK
jgi:SAM-dependent methyltransferase